MGGRRVRWLPPPGPQPGRVEVLQCPYYISPLLSVCLPVAMLVVTHTRHRSAIPHSVLNPEDGVECCLIVKDPAKAFKAQLAATPVGGFTKVIGASKLRKNYAQYKDRAALADGYDAFFCDDRVVRMMPQLLGKVFFDKKKHPAPVRVDRGGWALELTRARDATYMHVGWGATTSIRVGKSHMPAAHVVANVMAAAGHAAAAVPRKWANVLSVHLSATNSASLPVFKALPGGGSATADALAEADALDESVGEGSSDDEGEDEDGEGGDSGDDDGDDLGSLADLLAYESGDEELLGEEDGEEEGEEESGDDAPPAAVVATKATAPGGKKAAAAPAASSKQAANGKGQAGSGKQQSKSAAGVVVAPAAVVAPKAAGKRKQQQPQSSAPSQAKKQRTEALEPTAAAVSAPVVAAAAAKAPKQQKSAAAAAAPAPPAAAVAAAPRPAGGKKQKPAKR